MTREAHGGGTEVGAVDTQSNRGLQPRPGQLGSSEEAGRANGAGRDTEDGSRGHCEGSGMDRRTNWRTVGGGEERTGKGVDEVEVERNSPAALGFCGWCEVVDASGG